MLRPPAQPYCGNIRVNIFLPNLTANLVSTINKISEKKNKNIIVSPYMFYSY